jgi:translocator protein
MNKDVIRQWANMLAVLATIIMNILANALPLNGQNTGEISDRFPVFFVPAGYVFSIWGVIYLGLLAFAIFQMLPAQKENPRLRRVGYLFVWSCVANILWLFLWHYNYFLLTEAAMLALLGLLIAVYQRLEIGIRRVPAGELWSVHVPFSIYLGWISVATIANTADVLYDIAWNGFGIPPEYWAVIMLTVALLLGILMAVRRGDVAYVLVLAWAFFGISFKQTGYLVPTMAMLAAIMALLIAALAFFIRWKTLSAARE